MVFNETYYLLIMSFVFMCQIYCKPFAKSQQLERHILYTYSWKLKNDNILFVKLVAFVQKGDLKKLMAIHHGLKKFICPEVEMIG